MSTVTKSILVASILAASPEFASVPAQSAPTAPSTGQSSGEESRQMLPELATGVGIGTMQFRSGRSETAVSATLQYSPNAWLSFSATPGYGRTSLGRGSSNGLTDLPLSAGASHGVGGLPWSPSIFASIYTALSFADTAGSLGTGRTALGASTSISAWVTKQLNLAIGASRPLSADAGNGSLDLETAYSLGKATPNLGLTSEVGRVDSNATLARSIAAGVAFALAGPLTLTVDGSRGLTAGAPSWTLSAGIGTAFAGVSPLNPSSSLRRLTKVLGSRVSSTSGYAKGGTGSRSCKTAGTC
jgi:hypothetical protein